jgi:hypothetical protein
MVAATSFAVCLTGGSRTFGSSVVAHNIRSQLIDALPGSADVFVVLPLEELANVTEVQASLRVLAPITVMFYSDVGYDDKCARSQFWAPIFYSQWMKVRLCFEAVQMHEAVVGRRYDYFVRARPDVFYLVNVRTWLRPSAETVQVGELLWKGCCGKKIGCASTTPTNDHFAVVPRSFAKVYAYAAEVLDDCTATHADVRRVCHECNRLAPECFLSYHLLRNNITYHGCFETYSPPSIGSSPPSVWTVSVGVGGVVLDRFKKFEVQQIASWTRQPAVC